MDDLYQRLVQGRMTPFRQTMVIGARHGRDLADEMAAIKERLAAEVGRAIVQDPRFFLSRYIDPVPATAVQMDVLVAAPFEVATMLSEAYSIGYNRGGRTWNGLESLGR